MVRVLLTRTWRDIDVVLEYGERNTALLHLCRVFKRFVSGVKLFRRRNNENGTRNLRTYEKFMHMTITLLEVG